MVTPIDDFERFAENLQNKFNITSREEYDDAFNQFMEPRQPISGGEDTVLRAEAFKLIERKLDLFKRAGGKDLKKDRRTTAQRVVETPAQFIKAGAQRTDLRDLDTAQRRINPGSLTFKGTVKGKQQVKARRENIKVRGKAKVVFRDRRGRFVKVRS